MIKNVFHRKNTNNNNLKSVMKRHDWLSDVNAASASAVLSSAPRRPPGGSPRSTDCRGWAQRTLLLCPPTDAANTQTQCGKTGEQRSSSSVMNEEATWLISEVCTMSFKVNLIFFIFFFKSAWRPRISVRAELHLLPVTSRRYLF